MAVRYATPLCECSHGVCFLGSRRMGVSVSMGVGVGIGSRSEADGERRVRCEPEVHDVELDAGHEDEQPLQLLRAHEYRGCVDE